MHVLGLLYVDMTVLNECMPLFFDVSILIYRYAVHLLMPSTLLKLYSYIDVNPFFIPTGKTVLLSIYNGRHFVKKWFSIYYVSFIHPRVVRPQYYTVCLLLGQSDSERAFRKSQRLCVCVCMCVCACVCICELLGCWSNSTAFVHNNLRSSRRFCCMFSLYTLRGMCISKNANNICIKPSTVVAYKAWTRTPCLKQWPKIVPTLFLYIFWIL